MLNKELLRVAVVDFWDGATQDELDVFLSPIREVYNVVEDYNSPDLLIYSCFGDAHLKYQNCKRLFICGENVVPDFNSCDFSISTLKIQFENRNFWFPWGLYLNYPTSSIAPLSLVKNPCDRNFCSFIYSQDSLGEGAKLRKKFCECLMRYRHVDCPGNVLHNMDSDILSNRHDETSWHESKIRFLSNYKFNIAFENSDAHGYITEKLIDCYMANTVPIYWGSKGDIAPFSPDSVICAHDYDSFGDLIQRILELDQNEELYLKALNANPLRDGKIKFISDFDERLRCFLMNVVSDSENTSHRIWSDSYRCNLYKKELEKYHVRLVRNVALYVKKIMSRIFG